MAILNSYQYVKLPEDIHDDSRPHRGSMIDDYAEAVTTRRSVSGSGPDQCRTYSIPTNKIDMQFCNALHPHLCSNHITGDSSH